MPLPERILEKRSIDPIEFLINVLRRIAESETEGSVYEDCDETISHCLFIHINLQRPFAKIYRTANARHNAERNIMQEMLKLQTVRSRF